MLQRRSIPDGPVFYASPLLEAAGVPHAFSTRIGGISLAPFDSLNLGNPSGCERQDDDARIQENYRRLQSAIGHRDTNRCWVHQVHGAEVLDAGSPSFQNGLKADALVTNQPGRVLAVRVADCVPILIADDTGRTVTAVHAGWRGVVAQIIPAAIRKMCDLTPSLEPHRLIAAIGPCIGFDAFEVGSDVLAEFRRVFGSDAPVSPDDDSGKGHVDLAAACRMQLLDAGLDEHRIDTTDRCTYRDAGEFFSHRRDNGVTGRMAAIISPRSR
jgi:YfiH family protein